MKIRIVYYIIIFFTLISCEDTLDLKPTDSLSSENAIKDESGLQKAILGCYDALQSDDYYGGMLLIVNEIGSDNAYHGGTILEYEQFDKNNVQADNLNLSELWSAPYIAINRCNTTIFYANKLALNSEELRNEYLAELYFLRALNYYNLTCLFKDIPLKLDPTFNDKNLDIPVSNQSVIYNQILKDLEFANNKLRNNDPFFATDLAVKTLLAKVFLDLGLYNTAISYADIVLSSEKKLLTNYKDLFISEGNSESIFELSYTELLTDKNRISEFCFPNNLSGRYEIAPSEILLNSFEKNDSCRKQFTGDTPYCIKYEGITSGDDNIYIFRLAELYLLRAEARALAKGNLYLIRDDINKIRNRVGLDDINSGNYNELLDIIDQERKVEFAFEGHRRFDLIRTKRASEILGINESNYYYPIPLSEINANSEIN